MLIQEYGFNTKVIIRDMDDDGGIPPMTKPKPPKIPTRDHD